MSDQPDAESSTRPKNNTHKRPISTLPAGFEPAIPTTDTPLTHDLYCAATGNFTVSGKPCILRGVIEHAPYFTADYEAPDVIIR